MSIRTYDPDVFRHAFDDHPEYMEGIEPEDWVGDHKNLMFEKDGSVGLFTYNYPGVYTGHWFFKVRGRKALDLAREMLREAFSGDVKVVRGMTSVNLPAARWAARQIGMTSHGMMTSPKWGECELFTLTKKEFEA